MENRSFISKVMESVYSKTGINLLRFYVLSSIIFFVSFWLNDRDASQTDFFTGNAVFAATLAFLLYAGLHNHRSSKERAFYDRIKHIFNVTDYKKTTKEQLIQVKWVGLKIVDIKINDLNPNGRLSREGSLWKDVVIVATDVFHLDKDKTSTFLQELPKGKMTIYVKQNDRDDEALFFAEVQYVEELHNFVYSDNFSWGTNLPNVYATLYAQPSTSNNFIFNGLLINSDEPFPNETVSKFQTMFVEKYKYDKDWHFVNSERSIDVELNTD